MTSSTGHNDISKGHYRYRKTKFLHSDPLKGVKVHLAEKVDNEQPVAKEYLLTIPDKSAVDAVHCDQTFPYLDSRASREITVKILAFPAIDPMCQEGETWLKLKYEMQKTMNLDCSNIILQWYAQLIPGDNSVYPPECLQFMEYCEGGDLQVHLLDRFNAKLPVPVSNYAAQILNALNYIHSPKIRIIHRDLKAANVFITGKRGMETLKIGDFGELRELQYELTCAADIASLPKISWRFISPEIRRHVTFEGDLDAEIRTHVGRLTDIYSFGCVLLQLVGIDGTKLEKPRFFRPRTDSVNGTKLYSEDEGNRLRTVLGQLHYLSTGAQIEVSHSTSFTIISADGAIFAVPINPDIYSAGDIAEWIKTNGYQEAWNTLKAVVQNCLRGDHASTPGTVRWIDSYDRTTLSEHDPDRLLNHPDFRPVARHLLNNPVFRRPEQHQTTVTIVDLAGTTHEVLA